MGQTLQKGKSKSPPWSIFFGLGGIGQSTSAGRSERGRSADHGRQRRAVRVLLQSAGIESKSSQALHAHSRKRLQVEDGDKWRAFDPYDGSR